MENKDYIKNAFTDEELKNGVWDNWDGRSNILTKELIHLISDKISFDDVKIILDVGSRDGLQSLEFNRWFPNAKIYAFEPIKSSYEFIKNITKNIKNIKPLPYAINSYNGKTKFYEVYNGNIGASSLLKTSNHPRSNRWLQKEVEVECINLEDWLNKEGIDKVDIAWVDVQGAEEIVFKSFGKYLDNISVIGTEVGVTPLYNGAIIKDDLDNQLNMFNCISAKKEPSGTEIDAIYLNKKI